MKSYTSLIENTYMIMLTIVWHVRTMQENGCTGMELLKYCNESIDKVEKKVLVLNGEGKLDEF